MDDGMESPVSFLLFAPDKPASDSFQQAFDTMIADEFDMFDASPIIFDAATAKDDCVLWMTQHQHTDDVILMARDTPQSREMFAALYQRGLLPAHCALFDCDANVTPPRGFSIIRRGHEEADIGDLMRRVVDGFPEGGNAPAHRNSRSDLIN